jgi:hypothetical protein
MQILGKECNKQKNYQFVEIQGSGAVFFTSYNILSLGINLQ